MYTIKHQTFTLCISRFISSSFIGNTTIFHYIYKSIPFIIVNNVLTIILILMINLNKNNHVYSKYIIACVHQIQYV